MTLGHDEELLRQQLYGVDSQGPEEVPDHLLGDPRIAVPSKRLIIAVDFGTTYSAVSYVALDRGESPPYLDLDRIRSIQNYPDDWNNNGNSGDRMMSEVPTEVIYPLDRHFRQKEDLQHMDEVESEHEAPAVRRHTDVRRYPVADPWEFPASDDEDVDSDYMSIENEPTSFRWGYGVHEAWGLHATHSDPNTRPLARFKLMLDNGPLTEDIRGQLTETLDKLKRKKIIKHNLQVIVDFLTCLLRHTKSQLSAIGYGDYRKEIVLCVPAIWSQKACREMQTAMAQAMEQARFEGVDVQNNSIENLFIVSEPEAAAAYVLETERDISVRYPPQKLSAIC